MTPINALRSGSNSSHSHQHLYQNKLVRQALAAHGGRATADGFAADPFRPLPLLEHASALCADLDLSTTFVVASVHLLEDGDYFLATLERHGLDPRRCAVLGKPYSTSMKVVLSLLGRGYAVHPASYQMDEREPLRRAREAASRSVLRAAATWCQGDRRRRILVLDSGGALIRLAHEPELAAVRDRCSAVESTSQGIFELESLEPAFPVINVARSWAKLTHESDSIGGAVADQLDRHVENLGARVERALVVGYGAIGRSVAGCLARRGLEVGVLDPAVRPGDVAPGQAHRADRLEAIRRAQLIVGCSGRASLSEADWGCLADGAILASASSYDVELRGWELRRAYRPEALGVTSDALGFDHLPGRAGPAFLGTRDDPSHYTYPVRFDDDRVVYLLAGGCPVNFTGGPFALPPEASALTMGLRLCGVAQAAGAGGRGLVPLRLDWQERLVERHLPRMREG